MRLLALVLVLGLEIAPAQTALVREWSVEIPTPAPANYPMAVCPDGRVYVSNAAGEVVPILPNGTLGRTQRNLDGFDLARSMTCAGNGALWVVAGRTIAGYRPRPDGELELSARVPVDVRVARFAVGGGLFYVLSATRAVNEAPLWIIDSNGRRLRSFGRVPSPMVHGMGDDVGFPLWVADRDELLFLTRHGYRIEVFDRAGHWLRNLEGRSTLALPVSLEQRQVQQILGAALSDGRLVVLARGYTGRTGWPLAFLDVYDRDLNLVEDTIPAVPGNLVGSSADGALYFAAPRVSTLQITRMRLAKRF